MTWIEIFWRFFALLREVMKKAAPKQGPTKPFNKPGPTKKPTRYGPEPADKGKD